MDQKKKIQGVGFLSPNPGSLVGGLGKCTVRGTVLILEGKVNFKLKRGTWKNLPSQKIFQCIGSPVIVLKTVNTEVSIQFYNHLRCTKFNQRNK